MNRWIYVAVIVVVLGLGWLYLKKNVSSNSDESAASVVPPKTVAPAHQIPTDVQQNMQEALADRQKKLDKLAELQKTSKTK